MRIILEDPPDSGEDEVIVRVKNMTDSVRRAIELLKSPESVTVYVEGSALLLPIRAIFYAESVDLKTFVCADKAVYQSKLKLYELEETLGTADFLRVSKQIIVNVSKIKSVSSAGGGRLEAQLANGEKVIVSRQYVPDLKARFGL